MAVKASRYLTHIKRLHDPEEPVHRLMTHAAALGDRLGPILLQLPPTLQADPEVLNACLACFPTAPASPSNRGTSRGGQPTCARSSRTTGPPCAGPTAAHAP